MCSNARIGTNAVLFHFGYQVCFCQKPWSLSYALDDFALRNFHYFVDFKVRNFLIFPRVPGHYLQKARLNKYSALNFENFVSCVENDSNTIVSRIGRNATQEGPSNKLVNLPLAVAQITSSSRFYWSNRRMIACIYALLGSVKAVFD